jgi:serine O-acetyltransferase
MPYPSIANSPMRYHHSSTYFTQLFAHTDEVEGNQKDLADLLTNLLPDEAELTLNPPQGEESDEPATSQKSSYDLGLGINLPVSDGEKILEDDVDDELHWYAPEPVIKTPPLTAAKNKPSRKQPIYNRSGQGRTIRKMVARRQEDQVLRGALWHEEHYDKDPKANTPQNKDEANINSNTVDDDDDEEDIGLSRPELFYPDIDLSIPESIYSETKDVVWDLMRWEAYQEAQREPLLVSFFYSSILNHDTLESSLSFLLANKLASPAMISTQVQSLVAEALRNDPSVGRAIRADIMAVRDRDPACTCLPDVFLYFKGFQALQTYRVAHILWEKKKKKVLAHYLQSQMSQSFQIDIHPNATLGSGIMLDHGTGIVIGETARVGHNCSILHHVTLGGSGKKGVDRHPKVGEGVLLGAGASILGNVKIGDGCQVGAGTLVITDLPAHSVAVGVPAKIIGSFVDVTEQPSKVMNQMMDTGFTSSPFQSEGI